MGRHTVPPRTTKRRTTTNLKTKNNQDCQKIELYRNLKTEELKKKHSSRTAGGVETGSWVERTDGKMVAAGPGRQGSGLVEHAAQHLRADKPGGTTGE